MIQQNQKLMSDLGRKFGKIIEHMFIPNLKEKFNAQGYEFGKASSNVFIENRAHNIYAEIDVFLENGDCALAVEVKTQAGISDIQEHMERMEKLRRYFDLHGDTRKLYGAMAAAVIPGNVHDYALKQGFYLIRQSGDTVSIEEPQGKPRAW
jgi:predicted AAA+ superfamily ATPase